MTQVKRIGAFYSHGPHFRKTLKRLREDYANACVVAMVPPGFPEGILDGLADEVWFTERKAYSLRGHAALRGLIRQIRGGGFDLFVIMFPSPKLRFLAGCSGAKKKICHGPDGRVAPIRMAPLRALTRAALRRIRGELTYTYIRVIVRYFPVKHPK